MKIPPFDLPSQDELNDIIFVRIRLLDTKILCLNVSNLLYLDIKVYEHTIPDIEALPIYKRYHDQHL